MDTKEIIKKMLENDVNNSPAWYLLGIEYKKEKAYSEALQAFSEAMKSSDEELRKNIIKELSNLSSVDEIKDEVKENKKEVIEDIIEEVNEEADELEVDTISQGDEREDAPKLSVINGHKIVDYPVEEISERTIDFEDVGGLENVKEAIRMKIIKPFTSPGLFTKFNKKIGGGILLYGPPGCGKTFIARATAGECNANFIPVQITDILDPYLGVSARNVKDIFFQARLKKPCIMFFDEIDSIGYNRNKLTSEHMRPIIDQMLAEIEGIDSSTDKLLLIGATNMPWDVDAAFKRPGRFDRTIFVQPPDLAARISIFKIKLKDKPVGEINYQFLAEQTDLYSGADIENVIEIATENVINHILQTGVERDILMGDLLEAIKVTIPSTLEWLKTIKNYVKYSNQAGLYDDVQAYLTKYKNRI